MPKTVKAKFLLGWMSQHEAIDALNACIFDPPLTKKKAIKLWKEYQDKVNALQPRASAQPSVLSLSTDEKAAIDDHIKRIQGGQNASYLSSVIKLTPEELVAHQYHVITERADQYGQQMKDDATRIKHCLGVGLEFVGQVVPRQVGPNRVVIDLPHMEFVPVPVPGGFTFQERDRYITAVMTPSGNRTMLWGGYHRTYALLVLRQAGGEAAGAAPLLTVMTGIPEVGDFFTGSKRVSVRKAVLGERPALLRDFLDGDLFIEVNLRKKRAEGRIERVIPTKLRGGVFQVDDE
jgi:hypothetical protein